MTVTKWLLGVLTITLCACGQTNNNTQHKERKSYFDISEYFTQEANRLQNTNPLVNKHVAVNGKLTQKKVRISNWHNELAIFKNADINKSSWQGEFSKTVIGDTTTYSTNNAKIPVKKVQIITDKLQKIKAVKIFQNSINALYISTDTLIYYPDSLLWVANQQKIKLLETKSYRIKTLFK